MTFTGRDAFLLACIVAGTAVLMRLGFWQVERLPWKEAMIERAQTNSQGEPVPLAEIERRRAEGEDIEYNPVTVSGTFDHAGEQYYLATFRKAPGLFLYTPLRLDDGRMLWVNRGFIPQELKDPATRPDSLVEGRVTIEGLARDSISEKPNWFVPNNDLEKRIFHWKSITQMAANAYDKTAVGTVPFFVDARADEAAAARYPIGGVTRITFPNSHLQYAVTWFGLALTLVVVGGVLMWRRVTSRREDTTSAP